MRLNLGCCDRHIEGCVNVDIVEPADVIADLREDWPWEDSSVERIYAVDILEHLPNKVHSMNEAWRVLEPDGKLEIHVPTTDGWGAFQDPTHVSFWTPNDLLYYVDGCAERKRFGKPYGIHALFRVTAMRHYEVSDDVWYLDATLEAIK